MVVNSGIIASAWKLAYVIRGWADMSLLKTVRPVFKKLADNLCRLQYELERRKYAQDLITFDKEFAHLFSAKPQTAENQDGISHEVFLR